MEAMKKHARRALFLSLVLLFLAGAPLLVLYSQGYRIDWAARRISQTGGIYVKTIPSRTTVRVEKTTKLTDFLFGTILIDNLIADRDYEVTVSKPGFQTWSKNLPVSSKEVTEAKNIVLFPENVNFTEQISGVLKASLSPDGKRAALTTASGTELLNLETEKSRFLTQSVQHPVWDSRSQRLLVANTVFDVEAGKCLEGCRVQIPFQKALLYQGTLFALSGSRLQSISYETTALPITIAQDVHDFALSDSGEVFWLTAEGEIFTGTPPSLLRKTIPPSSSSRLLVFANIPFLLNEGEFTGIHDTLILSSVSNLVSSPEGKKLLVQRGSELWLQYLKDEAGQPAHRAGETVFLTRLSQTPKDLVWLTSNYVMFTTGNKITIMETDTRDRLNTIEIGEAEQVFWSQNQKRVYALEGSSFSSSDRLLP